MVEIAVKLAPNAHGWPQYATEGAAGADICAAADKEIPARTRALIQTGIYIEIPEGYEGQVRPRSGLALKHGITVLNAPGTIDSDYRGEIGVVLYNSSDVPFFVKRGDRIAQLVIAPVARAEFVDGYDQTATQRGSGGFGSTGV